MRRLAICLLLLCLAVSAAGAEGGVKLTEVTLPAPAKAQAWMPISLSPDGQTVLWRDKPGACLWITRGDETHKLTYNAKRGAPDTHHRMERLGKMLIQYPFEEGAAWSPDGRWLALTAASSVVEMARFEQDLILVDAQNGEAFLIADRETNVLKNGGAAIQAAFDRSGKYLNYSYIGSSFEQMQANGDRYGFVRYDLETGENELLWSNDMDTLYVPGLYETAAGTWLSVSVARNGNSVLTAFPWLDGWSLQRNKFAMDWQTQTPEQMQYSAVSGYGLILNTYSALSVVRITPMGAETDKAWLLWPDENSPLGCSFVQADSRILEYSRYQPRVSRNLNGESESPLETWEEYDQALKITPHCCAISPDGRSALLHIIRSGDERVCFFALLDQETMKLQPVETPEGVAGYQLTFSALGRSYMPNMLWNADGTLLIQCEDTKVRAFRLE